MLLIVYSIFARLVVEGLVVEGFHLNTPYDQWADAGIQSYFQHFWDPNETYINAAFPSDGRLTGYWDFAQGFDAVIDSVNRTGGQQYYTWLNTFFDAQNRRGGFIGSYYDDENWMALALLRAHYLALDRKDPAASKYLEASTTLFLDISKAWDTTCCGSVKGGLWWNKAHTQKATAANAGPVILAARMYALTGNKQYLGWAEQWFWFWAVNMVSSTYQVADHYEPDGTKIWWKFTYNNGLMVGAATELFKVTHNSTYLSLAQKYASFMVTDMTVDTQFGPVLTDGTSAGCTGDCTEFKGPSYRYLIELYQTDPDNSKNIYGVLQASAQAIWQIARDSSRNLFSTNWAEDLPSSAVVSDSQQNAACQALSLWARNSD